MLSWQSMTYNTTDATESPIISLHNISMYYNKLCALRDINIQIYQGEVHAIVGEHGAGKSSLGMVMSGMVAAYQGQIKVRDNDCEQYSLTVAQRNGIRMVYQENLLNEYFSVAENILYKSDCGSRFGVYSKKRVYEHARRFLSEHHIDIDPKTTLHHLNLSERTVVEIMKNLYTRPALLILDETLEKLSADYYSRIIPILMKLKDEGMSVVTITHKIDDIYDFADRVSVLKDGTLLLTDKVDNINKLNLIRMAYTKVGVSKKNISLDTEFYQIIKYNEAILQFLPVNIIVVDDQMNIKMVNEYCMNSYLLAEQEYLNTSLSDFLQESPTTVKLIQEGVSSKEPSSFYNVQITFKSKVTINNIKTYPVFDGLSILGTIIIIEDMTEYDRLQKQLIISEKLASVGLLAAGVAHEINNPLEIISNYLSYLKYTQTNRDVVETVDKVKQEISYISKIVSNLVTFSDHRKIGHQPVDINHVISEILTLLRYNAEYRHVDVKFNFQNKKQMFIGDDGQIKQVILNLIKNSFEAMPEGGEVNITTKDGQFHGMKSTRLIFEDDGPGIQVPDVNSIFLPFYSTKTGKKSKFGLGLGLSISYRIVESFKGEMRVQNLPKKGCRFIIDLPNS